MWSRSMLSRRSSDEHVRLAQNQPVIPDFGEASDCVQENRIFCADWVRDNWAGVIQPALLDHIKLTLLAVAIGFVLAFAAALLAHRYRITERPFVVFSAVVYTLPSLALFQLLVPVTGLDRDHRRGRARRLHAPHPLPQHRSRVYVVSRQRCSEAARGMGLTRSQTLWRVELPLAVPAMMAGLRVAVVSTIALATVAAFVIPQGLGLSDLPCAPRGRSRQRSSSRAALAVLLALVADGLLVIAERALTPWARARRTA